MFRVELTHGEEEDAFVTMVCDTVAEAWIHVRIEAEAELEMMREIDAAYGIAKTHNDLIYHIRREGSQ